jgi:hypothetical protein
MDFEAPFNGLSFTGTGCVLALSLTRDHVLRALAMLLVILMYSVAFVLAYLTLRTTLFGERIATSLLSLPATILFALPALRKTFPDAPPYGVYLDIYCYIVCEVRRPHEHKGLTLNAEAQLIAGICLFVLVVLKSADASTLTVPANLPSWLVPPAPTPRGSVAPLPDDDDRRLSYAWSATPSSSSASESSVTKRHFDDRGPAPDELRPGFDPHVHRASRARVRIVFNEDEEDIGQVAGEKRSPAQV